MWAFRRLDKQMPTEQTSNGCTVYLDEHDGVKFIHLFLLTDYNCCELKHNWIVINKFN